MAKVAIIGGGMSGVACATKLHALGHHPFVFDTGKRGVGGRMATRKLDEADIQFDHACQFFTATNPTFNDICSEWQAAGIITPWHSTMVELQNGVASPLQLANTRAWVGVDGMESIPQKLAQGLPQGQVFTGAWISRLKQLGNGKWEVLAGDMSHGIFDYVIIAHNGKCANRLTASKGLESINKVLVKLRLSSIWVLAVAFEEPLLLPFDCAFVKGSQILSCICNQRSKLPTMKNECWVLLSTAEYGKLNKVPQEFIPEEAATKVRTEMLNELVKVTGIPKGKLSSLTFHKLQLWGAALPLNLLHHSPMILDPGTKAGICGDWCVEPSVQGAVLSGIALAEAIDASESGCRTPYLSASFQPVHLPRPIGAFPGLDDTRGKSSHTTSATQVNRGAAFEQTLSQASETIDRGRGKGGGTGAHGGGDSHTDSGKHSIRKEMWDSLEKLDLADFPRPCHNRIPNFKGAAAAAQRLTEMDIFKAAKCIEVNPDTAQKDVRAMALQQGKQLLVPSPRLKGPVFFMLDSQSVPHGQWAHAATHAGLEAYGRPMSFSSVLPHVDLIVLGSVAVDPSGFRLGKGEGFADLEHAILWEKGAVDRSTIIVTTVHDHCVRSIPGTCIQPHDVPVDYIVTPTRVIATNTKLPRPEGLLWHLLSSQKINSIPVLQELRSISQPARNVDHDAVRPEQCVDQPASPIRTTAARASQPKGPRRGRGSRVQHY